MDAANLVPFDYGAEIVLASNDPATPRVTDPVIFHVGTVDIAGDVDPDTLNRDSEGRWITAYIELPAEYDPLDVLEETVLFNMTVRSDRMEIRDENGNGVPDLVFKFRRSEVQDVIPTDEDVAVMVTGEIRDTIFFKAEDVIRVIGAPTVIHPIYGVLIDTDGDGVADQFETRTGIYVSPEDTGTDPDFADTDGDGFEDGREIELGTDPNDPASFPLPQVPVLPDSGVLALMGAMLATGIGAARWGSRRAA